jgi:cyanophycinase
VRADRDDRRARATTGPGHGPNRRRRSGLRAIAICGLGAVALLGPLGVDGAAGAGPSTVLAPVGGGYEAPALQGFARLVATRAPGPTVHILVVPSAYGATSHGLAQRRADQVQAACRAVLPAFPRLRSCTTTLVPLFRRSDAYDPSDVRPFGSPSLDGVFILGGDQDVAMEILAGTPAEAAMAGAYRRGVVFSGTSAGAAVESKNMLAGFSPTGSQANELQRGAIDMWWANDGLHRGLVFGSTRTIIDQHFDQRGRLGRLVNAVAQSAQRYGSPGLVGLGVDYATGVAVGDDATISGVWGRTEADVVDLKAAGASYAFEGSRQVLSARNILTDLLPVGPYGYDLGQRVPLVDGRPLPFRSPGPWPKGILTDPGSATLILGGDLSGDFTGPAMARFVSLARSSSSARLVLGLAGYSTAGQAASASASYARGLRQAGWTGTITSLIYGKDPFTPSKLSGAAGVLLVGGDQAELAGPVRDGSFARFVRDALTAVPVVMTDRAMTAAMGQWYTALPEPTKQDIEDQAIADFHAGQVPVRPGLDLLPGAAFEPRLTADYRWGRLYSLAMAHPATIAFGLSQGSALLLAPGRPPAATGDTAIVALDGRSATWGVGTNGAIAALNVLLDTYAPGDTVSP